MNDADAIRALPKVELHVHVEGAAPASTIAELAARNGVDLGVGDPQALYKYRDLADFLRVFDLVCRSLVHADDIHRVTYESLQIAHRAGVRYREMFFSPTFLMRHGVSFDTIWDGLAAGVRDAEHDFGLRCKLIMDVDKPSGPSAARELLELAASCDRAVLVGIGGDAGERGVDLRAFAPLFADARRHGWRTTMHLGEEGPVRDIDIGVRELGVERIDHGVSLVDDPTLVAEVIRRGISVTCCPSSNLAIGVIDRVADHPIARLRAAGVQVTVNSDNAEMFGVDAADELTAVVDAFGWTLDDATALCLDGIDACWMSDDERRRMRAEFEAALASATTDR
jgi:adenine deaminase